MSQLIITVIAATFTITSVAEAQPASASSRQAPTDPAVVAYTTLVKHVELDMPIDRHKVIAFVDLLIGTLEGFAVGRGVSNEALFSRIHQERRELRQFANSPIDAPNRERQGHQLFAGIVQHFKDVHRALGPNPEASTAIEALDRSAKSLEFETVLRWQPHNIEQFLHLGGEALTKMASKPSSNR